MSRIIVGLALAVAFLITGVTVPKVAPPSSGTVTAESLSWPLGPALSRP